MSRFEDLYAAHSRAVLAYCLRRTRSQADAEDALAEAFVIAWRKRDDVPREALPWLLAVARRVLANQRRGSRRRAGLVTKLEQLWRSDPAGSPATGEGVGRALAALARLRPDDQELLRLVAWEELDHRSIGLVMRLSPNAVAIRLHRARRRFSQAYLKGSGTSRTSPETKGAVHGAAQERVE